MEARSRGRRGDLEEVAMLREDRPRSPRVTPACRNGSSGARKPLKPGHDDRERLPEHSTSRGIQNGTKGRHTER